MTKALKKQEKVQSGIRRIDSRLIELVKHLARHAAEQDYKDLKAQTDLDNEAHGDANVAETRTD